MAVYLDCAATTPIDPRVLQEVIVYLDGEFGNAGSSTHAYGVRARRAVERARDQLAAVAGCLRGEVVFTSGATESNNLAILGLVDYGLETGKTRIVSTQIEHKAVLEPLRILRRRGFDVVLVPPTPGGWVDPAAVREAVDARTLLVSVMHVNNETGVIQPIEEIAELLADHPAYFHVDAAQSFGRLIDPLRHPRIDLISISGHKIHAPKGIGALITRRRNGEYPPLSPLMYGGGQERGLRPGTLPVPLIVGLGYAAELARAEAAERTERYRRFRTRLLDALGPLQPCLHGDPERTVPYILNLSFTGVDSEELMEALRDVAAVSTGAACTATSKTCSHVLQAMGLSEEQQHGAIRLSWCHLTEEPNWERFVQTIANLRQRCPDNDYQTVTTRQ